LYGDDLFLGVMVLADHRQLLHSEVVGLEFLDAGFGLGVRVEDPDEGAVCSHDGCSGLP
jgi:hypothetical protein